MEEMMAACPMARACKGMAESHGSGWWMVVPGLVFIGLGISIMIYPRILVWLVAVALILVGLAMLMMVNVMRNFGRRVHDKPA